MIYHLLKIILDFIAAISWPLLLLIIVLILKQPLKKLLGNLKSVAIPPFFEYTSGEQIQEKEDVDLNSKFLAHYSESTRQQLYKTIEEESKQFNDIKEYAAAVLLNKFFNETYLGMYGSQLRMLLDLNSKVKIPVSDMKHYYDKAVESYPFMYQNYSYNDWLKWLSGKKLIELNLEELVITEVGRDFLKFIMEYGFNLTKAY